VPGPRATAEAAARRFLAGYLTVETYARFQTWLGRSPDLADMQAAWDAGDRKRATQAIPERTVDDLVVMGEPDECAAKVAAYFDAGLDAATLAVLPAAEPLTPAQRVDFLTELSTSLAAS
jgi:alkanesulfonate monooxygenase SsuD/methylene tetrahydromethanopterin reductase-like flavin-dependent oxidoreductase (luciferase family)